MKHIDVTVPLDARLPTYPNHTPFSLGPTTRVSKGDNSNGSTLLHMIAHISTHVDAPRHFFDHLLSGAGVIVIEGVNLRGVGSDGAPARVVLSRA
jgi:kynurenine formamidase